MIPYDPSEDDSLFLDYAAGMLEVLPYRSATITLYLDALASVLAQIDLLPPGRIAERQTMQFLFDQVHGSIQKRLELLAILPDREELGQLQFAMLRAAVTYRHQILMKRGVPEPRCQLPEPCPYHWSPSDLPRG